MDFYPELRTDGPPEPVVQQPLQNNTGPHDLQGVPWESQQNVCNAEFRHFKLDDRDPRQHLHSLKVLCGKWLRPDLRSKRHILDLLVLEQIDLSGIPELQVLVLENRLQTCTELEQLLIGREQPQEQEAPPNWDTKGQVTEEQAELRTQDFNEPEVQEPTQDNTDSEDTQGDSCQIPAFLRRAWNICFRNFHGCNLDPWLQLQTLQILCWNWLRPDLRSKEQILDLVVLEQFVLSSTPELQALVLESGVQTCAELEQLLSTGEQSQQAQAPQKGESEEVVPGAPDRQRGDGREEMEQAAGLQGSAVSEEANGGAIPQDTEASLIARVSADGGHHKCPRFSPHSRSSWSVAGLPRSEQESSQNDCRRPDLGGTFGADKRTLRQAGQRGDGTEKMEQKLKNITGGAAGSEEAVGGAAPQDMEDMLKDSVSALRGDDSQDMEQADGPGGVACSEEAAVGAGPQHMEEMSKAVVSALRGDVREDVEQVAKPGGTAGSEEAVGGAAPQDTDDTLKDSVSALRGDDSQNMEQADGPGGVACSEEAVVGAGQHTEEMSKAVVSALRDDVREDVEQVAKPGGAAGSEDAAGDAASQDTEDAPRAGVSAKGGRRKRPRSSSSSSSSSCCWSGAGPSGAEQAPSPGSSSAQAEPGAGLRCPDCGKTFPYVSQYNLHRRWHTGERPFRCSQCHQGFRQQSDLRVHMRTHTGERPFCCKQCGAAFAHHSTLRGHLRVHSGARPYVCGVCSRAFGHQGNLTAHMRTHSGLKPYTCVQCGRSFRQLGTYHRHRRLHRPPDCEQTAGPARDHAENRDG